MEGGIEENDSMAGIMYLKEWLIYQKSDKYVARGYVENHPRFFDGGWIRTSWIERIYYDENANAIRILLWQLNSTIYAMNLWLFLI